MKRLEKTKQNRRTYQTLRKTEGNLNYANGNSKICLTVSYEIKHSYYTFRYLSKWNENLYSSPNFYATIYSGFICNSQTWKSQLPFNWLMNRQLTMEYYTAIKGNELLTDTQHE